MAKLRSLLLLAFVAAAACSFTGGARAAPKKAAKAAKKVAPKKVAPKKAAPKPKPVAKKAPPKKSGGLSPSSDIGVTPPLGLFDPLGFLSRGPEVYRRYQEIEIKHGRLAMAANLGVIVTSAGIRFPGYISISQDLCAAHRIAAALRARRPDGKADIAPRFVREFAGERARRAWASIRWTLPPQYRLTEVDIAGNIAEGGEGDEGGEG